MDVNWEVQRDLEHDLFDTCYKGTPVPGAALYAGKLHPLVVMDMDNGWFASDVDINEGFRTSGWPWPSPIQLVVCYETEDKKAGSCGLYETEGGVVGEVVRYREAMTLRVVVAATGKLLQTRVLTSVTPKCPKKVSLPVGQWYVESTVTDEQVNDYATKVSRQKVK